ncbi:hypothetical protein AXE65_05440 [Ventosimonas gracilis]|uniref:Uncharacterized protein n=1 Tax=Ventosimonas gracilis TaxID=1680762 RepID=A0A139SNZ6_9GAMM|nr:tetratricopeptide repeat protein [Ventosimonas gracilis]KXU36325.1 hypothetical protein AXE65_05440 [Ventosimonas gracilis]
MSHVRKNVKIQGLLAALLSSLLLAGCVTTQGTPPVIEAGSPLPRAKTSTRSTPAPTPPQQPALPNRPAQPPVTVETFPAPPADTGFSRSPAEFEPQNNPPSISTTPSGIPSGGLSADEKLEGPVLALLSSAREQQGSGNLSGAAASLERAQRIAPREPQVLYRLAEVRLEQGDAEQAEQIAQRALSYAGDRPPLQAALWDVIARSREQRGDLTGAAAARAKARVNL